MNFIKKLLAIILSCTVIVTMFSACSSDNNSDVTDPFAEAKQQHMLAGEFYEMFVNETGISPMTYTNEDLENAEDSTVFAQTVADWDLISETTALNNMGDFVTKETVATVCANFITGVAQGDESIIKDIDKVEDKQAVANAVKFEIVTLENGYFDATHIMTIAECEDVVDKTILYKSSSTTNSDEEKIEGNFDVQYKEDVDTFDAETINPSDILSVETEENRTEPTSASNVFETPVVTPLNFTNTVKKNDSSSAPLLQVADTDLGRTTIKFNGNYTSFFVNGKKVVYDNFFLKNGVKYEGSGDEDKSFSGKVISCSYNEHSDVTTVTLQLLSMEEIIDSVKNDTYSIENGDLTFSNTADNASLSFGKENCKVKITSNKKSKSLNFTVTSGKSEVGFEVGNAKVNTENTWGLVSKSAGNGKISLSVKTTETFKYEFEKKATQKITSTSGESATTEKIKIAKINVPVGYGFSVGFDVYLKLSIDGTIDIECVQNNTLEVKRTSKGVGISYTSKGNEKADIRANIYCGLLLVSSVKWVGISLIDVSFEAGIKVSVACTIYEKTESSFKVKETGTFQTQSLYGDINDDELAVCLDATAKPVWSVSALSTDCAVGKLINLLGLKEPSISGDGKEFFHAHFEYDSKNQSGSIMGSCTRQGLEDAEFNTEDNIIKFDRDDVSIDFSNDQKDAYIKMVQLPYKNAKTAAKNIPIFGDFVTTEIDKGDEKYKGLIKTSFDEYAMSLKFSLNEKELKKLKGNESPTISYTISARFKNGTEKGKNGKKKQAYKTYETKVTVKIIAKGEDVKQTSIEIGPMVEVENSLVFC